MGLWERQTVGRLNCLEKTLANMAAYKIDQRQLMIELTASDPILKRVADQTLKQAFFDPAVDQLKKEWTNHPVTKEIAAGVDSANISNTLDARFQEDGKMDSPANLTSFIGFDKSPEEILAPIAERLDPSHPDGPKIVYNGRDKDKLNYKYTIKAPNEEAIENVTGLPFAPGISWATRIEKGLPGIGHFLNVKGRPSSRSGGGIQIEGTLRTGRFKPTSYLSQLFNNFLRKVGGLRNNGRSV